MVTRWGMSTIGLAAFAGNEDEPFLGYELAQGRPYSEATAARIDEVVQELLQERHRTVTTLLSHAKTCLDRLAQALLDEETVDEERLVALLGARAAENPPCVQAPAALSTPATDGHALPTT
jgi:cell division protease FtsH